MNHQSNAGATVFARLDTVDFSGEESLQVATICAHYGRSDCVNHLVERLPEPKQLDDAEVANVGELYLSIHEWDKGYNYLKTAMETHKSEAIDEISMQFAAAHGDEKTVVAWIQAHPDNMTPHLFNDLYYAAFENHQNPTAMRVAELYNAKYNNKNSRKLLADAYMKSGKYEQAVKFFRENAPLSQDEEDSYVSALIVLAAE